MGRNKRSIKNLTDEAMLLNRNTLNELIQDEILIAISRYEWLNLPKEIDYRYLEYILCTNGVAIFFKDDVLDEYATLQCTYGGSFDIYMIPKDRRAYAVNGYNKKLDETNSVFIFNNFLHTNEMLRIMNSSQRIFEIQRAIDTNVKGQKTPLVIQCSDKQRLTLQNLYMQYDGNIPFIFADKTLDMGSIQAIETNSPFVADKLEDLKKTEMNEYFTKMGVANSNITKRERVNTDEVMTNMGGVKLYKEIGLISRQQACEQINEMFGLNVSVRFRETDIYESIDSEEYVEDETEVELSE